MFSTFRRLMKYCKSQRNKARSRVVRNETKIFFKQHKTDHLKHFEFSYKIEIKNNETRQTDEYMYNWMESDDKGNEYYHHRVWGCIRGCV